MYARRSMLHASLRPVLCFITRDTDPIYRSVSTRTSQRDRANLRTVVGTRIVTSAKWLRHNREKMFHWPASLFSVFTAAKSVLYSLCRHLNTAKPEMYQYGSGNTPAGNCLESQPGYQLFWLIFSWFSSVSSGECCTTTVTLNGIFVELLSYRQHTQLIVRSTVYIYYSIITLRLVSESWFHHQEGY
jgi:hypothetical protein